MFYIGEAIKIAAIALQLERCSKISCVRFCAFGSGGLAIYWDLQRLTY